MTEQIIRGYILEQYVKFKISLVLTVKTANSRITFDCLRQMVFYFFKRQKKSFSSLFSKTKSLFSIVFVDQPAILTLFLSRERLPRRLPRKLPTYSSSEPTLTLTYHLGEGKVDSFPETYNDQAAPQYTLLSKYCY